MPAPVPALRGSSPNVAVLCLGLLTSGHDPAPAARWLDLPSLSPWGLVREKLLNRPFRLAPAIVVHVILIGTALGSL